MCPGIAPAHNNVAGACPNLTNLGPNHYIWSSYPTTNGANHVACGSMLTGNVKCSDGRNISAYYAFCK